MCAVLCAIWFVCCVLFVLVIGDVSEFKVMIKQNVFHRSELVLTNQGKTTKFWQHI